ncbi:MAG TPA: enoyl-CoA hydratase/isomerase family protein [Bryobacteraceae bacterium]
MTEILQSHRYGRVLRLTLNRPEKRNALSAELCRELVRAIEEAERDPAVGAILLAANGKAFCAGMDLSELGVVATPEIDRAQEQLFTLGARVTKPVVAAIAGPALGGGTGLAVNCHIVIASEGATFGLTEIRLGLWPFLVFRAVTAALGERRAVELSLTGRIFGAREAREMGLVHEVAADAPARAAEVAEALAGRSPTAIRGGMAFVGEVRGMDWAAAGAIARRVRNEAFESRDFQEGLRAFREKRPPRWPSLESPNEGLGE